ncbi:non-hydrolyzing UDP-N-acetylglucosamine 2-epimerase [Dankookia rubra]|uniref:non-hydrolyzing UDP-N-acetylglucosamine 2-epimerase n=1 Tax=Dankookia rubra TaxID=1442381 RepID=UPI001F4FE2F9|nr:UDP-N-acetylglucosamine 2-epimerase (non-hydrolyzing) [Dankookia rubra]
MQELHLVAAARPNLPKLAALWHALPEVGLPLRPVLLHTGQHQDPAMFGDHLAQLGLPLPEIALGVQGRSHAETTGRTLMALDYAWAARRPAFVVVAGDVDGALAAALAARKLRLPVAHLEAGLRGDDPDMPEELNRRAIDAVSSLLWAPDEASAAGLLAEGHAATAVRAVGNAMVDTLRRGLGPARARTLPPGLVPGDYGVVTLHRAANVDDPAALAALLAGIGRAAALLPLAWPLHPRTRARLAAAGLALPKGVLALPPLPYLDFLGLLARARLVATDSGGVQEEATALDLPCLTLRPGTERPVTLAAGTSRLVAPAALPAAVAAALEGQWPRARPIPFWDGRAGARMAAHLAEAMAGRPGG